MEQLYCHFEFWLGSIKDTQTVTSKIYLASSKAVINFKFEVIHSFFVKEELAVYEMTQKYSF
jgi:hypothetical protein